MKTKKCPECQRNLLLGKFHVRVRNGKESPCSYCKECNKDRLKKHYNNNLQYYKDRKRRYRNERRRWFEELKSTLQCNRCDERHIVCLEFHHIDPTAKEYNVGSMVNSIKPIQRIEDEIAKCEVLCSNCHRKEHYDGP